MYYPSHEPPLPFKDTIEKPAVLTLFVTAAAGKEATKAVTYYPLPLKDAVLKSQF